jgi:fumarate reductase subunit D
MRVARRGGPSRVEPLLWSLFAAGGMVAAFLMPISVGLLGIAFAAGLLPDGALSYERMIGLVRHPGARVLLGVLVVFPLFHWAHRFRFILHHQLGIHGGRGLVAAGCYGTAMAGTALAVVALVRV